MQPVVELFDRREGRRIGLVKRDEEREQPNRSIGGIGEFDRPTHSALVQLNNEAAPGAANGCEFDSFKTRKTCREIRNEGGKSVSGCRLEVR